jgi:hypothetical protein
MDFLLTEATVQMKNELFTQVARNGSPAFMPLHNAMFEKWDLSSAGLYSAAKHSPAKILGCGFAPLRARRLK